MMIPMNLQRRATLGHPENTGQGSTRLVARRTAACAAEGRDGAVMAAWTQDIAISREKVMENYI